MTADEGNGGFAPTGLGGRRCRKNSCLQWSRKIRSVFATNSSESLRDPRCRAALGKEGL